MLSIVLAALTATQADAMYSAVGDMTFPGMDVSLEIKKCGMVNAFYFDSQKKIIVCQEAIDLVPELIPGMVAHEMGHAIIEQLDLPITGSEEDAADEISIIYMAHSDQLDEVWKLALWYKQSGLVDKYNPQDDHSEMNHRAWTFACMAMGAEESPQLEQCTQKYKTAEHRWSKLIRSAYGQ
jgi:Zn-dependent membrane protease YugP